MQAHVDRLDRRRDQLAELRATLPWNCDTEEDRRALAVYFQAERRYLNAYAGAVMTIIPDLQEFDKRAPKTEKLTNFGKHTPGQPAGSVRELGLALKDLDDFCKEEVLPLVERLARGMDRIEACELSREGDAEHARLLDFWLTLRKRVQEAMIAAWRLATVAREEHQRLDARGQDEALAIWGPLTGAHPLDYEPLLSRSWPSRAIRDLDRRAAEQGVVDLNNPFPYQARVARPKKGKKK